MNYKKHNYTISDHYFEIDEAHSVIIVSKNNIEIANIPNNYNRELTVNEFFQIVSDYKSKH
ncbi:hypothetical protein [Bacillus sp. SM2101]|uniref:hypothetical protein n=1 Tax=Bacillus sp. SM2101 TaxID=2805366 RepID=UPI001BDE9A41|nr:hypothetical protein [Bacillus sp. SM2101]